MPCRGASVLVPCWLTSSRASQVVSKKGLPPGPAMRIVVSAGRLLLWQAWYLARESAHSFAAIPA